MISVTAEPCDFYAQEHRILDKYFGDPQNEDDAAMVRDIFYAAYGSQLQRHLWYSVREQRQRETSDYYPTPISCVVNCHTTGSLCDLIMTFDDGVKIEEHFDYLPTIWEAETWASKILYDRYLEADAKYVAMQESLKGKFIPDAKA